MESLAELQERLSEIPKCAAALSTVFINTRLETSLDLGRSGEGTRCRLSADFQHVLDSNSKPNKHSYFSQIFVSISPNFPTQTRVLLAVCWEEDVLNSDICLRLVSHNVAKSAGVSNPSNMNGVNPTCRILVVGRTTSGKITLLSKVCNPDNATKPVIYDEGGRNISLTGISGNLREKALSFFTGDKYDDIILRSSKRGFHDIYHQITYPGSRFVFHAAKGTSSRDIRQIRHFMCDRESALSTAERLHAIWFCIPMNNISPFSDVELSFLNEASRKLPVVIVFTKFEAQLDKAKFDLLQSPNSIRHLMEAPIRHRSAVHS